MLSNLRLILLVLIFSVNFDHAYCQLYTNWSNVYNNPLGNSQDEGRSLSVDNSGNIVVTGYTGSATSGSDIIILKYSNSGEVVWKKVFNAGTNISSQAVSVVSDNVSNYYVAGFSIVTSQQSKLIILKYDSSGNFKWNKFINYQIDSVTAAAKMIIDSSGYLYICGYTLNLNGRDVLLLKCNSLDGSIIWARTYNNIFNRNDEGNNIIFDNDKNIIVGGYSSLGSGNNDYLVLKYTSGGYLIWAENFNYRPEDNLYSLAVDKYNNVFATGGSRYYSPGPPPGHYYLESYSLTVKYDSAGNLLWSATDGMGCSDCGIEHFAYEIKTDTTGNAFIAGASNGDFKTIKYSSTGNLDWKKIYNRPYPLGGGRATNIVLYNEEYIYTFGYLPVYNGNSNIFWVNYFNSSGSQYWAGSYSGPGNDEIINNVVMDNNENIYLTGYSVNTLVNKDIFLLKYGFQPIGIASSGNFISDFYLSQNYPNPFNPVTNLEFGISKLGFVSLKIYDVQGREMKTLINEIKPAGRYNVEFDGSSYSSGIYFYTIETDGFIATKKMVLLK